MPDRVIRFLRGTFYGVIVRPVLIILLGLNVRNLRRLNIEEPRLIAANHNSHLDALVLMSLFKLRDLPRVKVVAAKDYFCRTPLLTWFSINIIGIIPIDRKGEDKTKDPIAPVIEALDAGYTVVIFPEGTRGDPEKRQPLKYGISKLLELKPEIEISPVFMHGLGKSLPRGEALLVPFVCEINIGEPLKWAGDRTKLITALEDSFDCLAAEMEPKEWL